MAQSEHLKFKGVPIDGTLSEFVAKMKNAGFSYLGQEEGIAVLEGDFAGFRQCNILVATYKPTGKVSMIAVIFPAKDDWGNLEGNYNSLKSMLSQKYGEPNDIIEEFQGYSQPKTNSDKMHKLVMDQCVWGSVFTTNEGDIELTIDKKDYLTGHVVLRYRDRINTDAVKQQAIDDL